MTVKGQRGWFLLPVLVVRLLGIEDDLEVSGLNLNIIIAYLPSLKHQMNSVSLNPYWHKLIIPISQCCYKINEIMGMNCQLLDNYQLWLFIVQGSPP